MRCDGANKKCPGTNISFKDISARRCHCHRRCGLLAFLACHPRRGPASAFAVACSFPPPKPLTFRPKQFALFANRRAEKPASSPRPFPDRCRCPLLVILTPREAEGKVPRIYEGSGATRVFFPPTSLQLQQNKAVPHH